MTYFLNFTDKKKISYAASNGKNFFTDEDFNKVNNLLYNFSAISVREYGLQQYLENKMRVPIKKVLDPVFMLNKQEWCTILPIKKNKKKYILVYVLKEDSIYYIAQRMAKLLNLKIICIQNNIKKPIKAQYKMGIGIYDFLELIKNAEYVITDSFHGVAFSVIFRANLKIVMKVVHNELNARLESLIKEFNLEDSIISKDSSDEKLKKITVYDEKKINESIQNSKNTLLQMIGD